MGNSPRTIGELNGCLVAAFRQRYELGEDFFERLNVDRLRYYYSKRLEALGYKVELTKGAAA